MLFLKKCSWPLSSNSLFLMNYQNILAFSWSLDPHRFISWPLIWFPPQTLFMQLSWPLSCNPLFYDLRSLNPLFSWFSTAFYVFFWPLSCSYVFSWPLSFNPFFSDFLTSSPEDPGFLLQFPWPLFPNLFPDLWAPHRFSHDLWFWNPAITWDLLTMTSDL